MRMKRKSDWATKAVDCFISLTNLFSFPSNFRRLVNNTVLAGIFSPMAKVSVANSTWTNEEWKTTPWKKINGRGKLWHVLWWGLPEKGAQSFPWSTAAVPSDGFQCRGAAGGECWGSAGVSAPPATGPRWRCWRRNPPFPSPCPCWNPFYAYSWRIARTRVGWRRTQWPAHSSAPSPSGRVLSHPTGL